jgi:two-component system chemotaxis response regulator CheY
MSVVKPKCVLVVDDDDTIRNLIAEVLDTAGFQVESATNGETALVIARSTRPDVIVLDLMMPIVDGWTFLQHMRKDAAVGKTPVIITSASHALSESVAALDVQAYLAKPFDLDALVCLVERLV